MAIVLRQSGGLLRQAAIRLSASAHAPFPEQAMYLSGNPFADKERGEESIRFRKEDERLLRQLLQKVKKQADAVDVHEAANNMSAELSTLKEILGKYNVSDADLQKVLEWKQT